MADYIIDTLGYSFRNRQQATRAIDILREQLTTNLGQMGVTAIDQLGPQCLMEMTSP